MSRKKNNSKQKINSQAKSTGKRARTSKRKLAKNQKPASKAITFTPRRKSRGQVEEQHTESASDPRFYIKSFFANYTQFNYNPSRPVMEEFYRMCDSTWSNRDDPDRQAAHDGIRDALSQQFNDIYGTDEAEISNWKSLCTVLQLQDIPNELGACRELVRSTHVNIVDLIDTRITRVKVQRFESERQLSEYTRRTGKYFPKENAYAGGLLKFLLRHITSPGDGKTRPSRQGSGRR